MTRLLIVEDHHLYVGALERELKQLQPDALVHRATTLKAALVLLAQGERYDMVFVDLKLPDAQGIDAVKAIVKSAPATKVAVISGYEEPSLMREAYEAGAIGFLSKGTEPMQFRKALALLVSGGFYFSEEALAARPKGFGMPELTPRERQVLGELQSGQSTKVIARKLGLAPTTVDKHIDQIRSKIGVATRMQLVARIQSLGNAAMFK